MLDHGCVNPNTCDICQGRLVREQQKISQFAIRETILTGAFRKQDPSAGKKIVGRHCKENMHEMLPGEKACLRCGCTDIILRYADEIQPNIELTVDVCVEHPREKDIRLYCPLVATA